MSETDQQNCLNNESLSKGSRMGNKKESVFKEKHMKLEETVWKSQEERIIKSNEVETLKDNVSCNKHEQALIKAKILNKSGWECSMNVKNDWLIGESTKVKKPTAHWSCQQDEQIICIIDCI